MECEKTIVVLYSTPIVKHARADFSKEKTNDHKINRPLSPQYSRISLSKEERERARKSEREYSKQQQRLLPAKKETKEEGN